MECLEKDSSEFVSEASAESALSLARDFKTAMFEGRSLVQERKGLAWPYQVLKKKLPVLLEKVSALPDDKSLPLYLLLSGLPFPGQWQYIEKIQEKYPDELAVKEIIRSEQRLIAKKIAKKSKKKLRFRNVIQVVKKPVSSREKGILRFFAIPYLFADKRLIKIFANDYVLFVEPAAGVNFRHTWMRFFLTHPLPVVFGAAGKEDCEFFRSQGAEAVQLAHSDFLSETEVEYREYKKEYDLCFNSTFDEMERKRHELLLETLGRPNLANVTALVLGRGEPDNVLKFQQMITAHGLEDRVRIMANLPRKHVPEYLGKCRLGVHLALMENGCRAIHEFFRQNIPCVVTTCGAGINFEHFNRQTGAAAKDSDLAGTIVYCLENIDIFSPRDWFLSQSGAINSSKKLNRYFKDYFLRNDMDWTEDMTILTGSGPHRYVSKDVCHDFLPQITALAKKINELEVLPFQLIAE